MLKRLVQKNVRAKVHGPILLIANDAQVRRSISLSLHNSNLQVIETEGVSQALAVLEQQIPSIIIHDIIMEDMDGLEFISKLRANSQWRSIVLIAISPEDISDQDHQRLRQSVNKVLRNKVPQHKSKDYQQAIQEVLDDLNHCASG
jgi:CheY-like chemotaxis protein